MGTIGQEWVCPRADSDVSMRMRSLRLLPELCIGAGSSCSPVLLRGVWMCHLVAHVSWCSGGFVLSAGFSLKEDTVPGNVHRNVQDGRYDGVQPARYDRLHHVPTP